MFKSKKIKGIFIIGAVGFIFVLLNIIFPQLVFRITRAGNFYGCKISNIFFKEVSPSFCREMYEPQGLECYEKGGKYRMFYDGCADSCEALRYPSDTVCIEVIDYDCDCGPKKCWSGEVCEQN